MSWVYEIDAATPFEELEITGNICYLKREDLSTVRSYKWRGAYTKLKGCLAKGDSGPFVATSAGNHAQGVALAAKKLHVQATIFMPRTTPKLKQRAVSKFGGEFVRIELVGDNFDQASSAALEYANENDCTIIRPFDDLEIIAGQSTVADEVVNQKPDLDYVFVPIGGGGLASGVSYAMRQLSPSTKVIGVEVFGQNSMQFSLERDTISRLDDVDIFCDGTAVIQPGELTYGICRDYLDEVITVTNEKVCAAIQVLWEERRVITEPSGAIGFAGMLEFMKERELDANSKCCAVISGANTDFLTLPLIVKKSQLAQPSRCYYRFEIDERTGSLIELLDLLFENINIVDFQYGKVSDTTAFPVLGLEATPEQQSLLLEKIRRSEIKAEDITSNQSTAYRVIPFRPDLTHDSEFYHVDFPDRPGALRELMREISSSTNICYFNFNDTGQIQGHALIGFEFSSLNNKNRFAEIMARLQFQFQVAELGAFNRV